MQELVNVTGMILKSEPIGEYDRRVVILTKERGKISAFARGARKPGNRFMASTNPFCFGEFKLYPGKSAYTLQDIHIDNFFQFFALAKYKMEHSLTYIVILFLFFSHLHY